MTCLRTENAKLRDNIERHAQTHANLQSENDKLRAQMAANEAPERELRENSEDRIRKLISDLKDSSNAGMPSLLRLFARLNIRA